MPVVDAELAPLDGRRESSGADSPVIAAISAQVLDTAVVAAQPEGWLNL
jgi:hypothetical protein